MKGIVFTEFIEMVEDNYGFETAEKIISSSKLSTNGVYTALGTYPPAEMVQMLTALSEESSTSVPELLRNFGKYLLNRFSELYKPFFDQKQNTFDFLEGLENHIHVEVKKLYPDAELPKFLIQKEEDKMLIMVYQSPRKLHDLALGLMEACVSYYGETIVISRKMIKEDGSEVAFELKKS
jgi:hypothetical protein